MKNDVEVRVTTIVDFLWLQTKNINTVSKIDMYVKITVKHKVNHLLVQIIDSIPMSRFAIFESRVTNSF